MFAKDKRMKCNNATCDPSIYAMDHPDITRYQTFLSQDSGDQLNDLIDTVLLRTYIM